MVDFGGKTCLALYGVNLYINFFLNKTPAKALTPPAEKKLNGYKVVFGKKPTRGVQIDPNPNLIRFDRILTRFQQFGSDFIIFYSDRSGSSIHLTPRNVNALLCINSFMKSRAWKAFPVSKMTLIQRPRVNQCSQRGPRSKDMHHVVNVAHNNRHS